MEINNENENYTLHYCFHTNILHIKSSSIPGMENNVNINISSYGETTHHTKHHTCEFRKKIYLSIY